MDQASVRSHCVTCGRRLGFDEWSRGLDRCPYCTSVPNRRRAARKRAPRQRAATAAYTNDYLQLLDEIPDELIDELAAMVDAEVGRRPHLAAKLTGAQSGSESITDEIGFGQTSREFHWAAWGFAGGFGLNVVLAKYAQVSANAAMDEFIAPMLLGGLVAGLAGAAIGWGAAKLREG